MNIVMLRQLYGKKQITIHAMTGREFRYFIESLDWARYEDTE